MNITLEDINTWISLFDFDVPIELDLSKNGEFELYDWDDTDTLIPKFNHDNSFFTIADDSVMFKKDGSVILQDYNRVNPFYMVPSLDMDDDLSERKLYFFPVSNINRLLFKEDYLLNQKCYVTFLGNVTTAINGFTPFKDDNGLYVPLSVVLDDVISCDVEGSKYFIPKVSYVYSPPSVSVDGDLFVGNNNSLEDLISCPVDYVLYYNNHIVSDFMVPVDEYDDVYRFKIVTKSKYPYIPYTNYVEIPCRFKIFESVSDVVNYSYLLMNSDLSFDEDLVCSSDCTVNGEGYCISSVPIVVDGDVVFDGVVFDGVVFEVNGSVEFNNCTFKNNSLIDYKLINNGYVSFNKCNFKNNGYIVNNNTFKSVSSTFIVSNKTMDLPLIHNTGNITLLNNKFIYFGQFNSNRIAVIRSNDLNTDTILNENTFNYDCSLQIETKQYHISGEGFCYMQIDDDTLNFKNLQVIE